MRAIAPLIAALAALLLAACEDPEALGGPSGSHPLTGVVVAKRALGFRPYGIAVSAAGTILVTQLDNATLAVGAVAGDSLVGSVGVGNTPTAVAFDPSGATAYVTNQFSNSVGVVDVASRTQIAQVPVGGNTFNLLVAPNGATVYATANNNVVYAISTSSRTVTGTVAVGQAPNGLVFGSGDTLLYVSSFVSGTVSEINVKGAMFISRTFTPGGSPQGLAISPDKRTLYVANENGHLDVINLTTGAVSEPVDFGASAIGLAMTPDATQLYATLYQVGSVAVVNLATLTIGKFISTGGDPRRVAFSADGLTAVIANQSGSVDFIR